MKFTNEHYNILSSHIKKLSRDLTRESIDNTLSNISNKYKGDGLSHERFCFDLFYRLNIKIGDGVGLSSNCGIVGDYNDSHIYTAISKVLKDEFNINKW